jgi:hypothetical protein
MSLLDELQKIQPVTDCRICDFLVSLPPGDERKQTIQLVDNKALSAPKVAKLLTEESNTDITRFSIYRHREMRCERSCDELK